MQSTSRAATIPTPSSASATPSPPVEAAPALAWIDATAGVAGDMLLGALVDAGASLKGVQAVLDALIPGSVRLRAERVDRCGQASTKVDVDVLVEDPPHRTWSSIRDMLTTAQQSGAVPARTCELALDAFSRLADAEAAAHGIPAAIYGAGPRTVLQSNAKRADEHLLLSDLQGATRVVARALAALLAG